MQLHRLCVDARGGRAPQTDRHVAQVVNDLAVQGSQVAG